MSYLSYGNNNDCSVGACVSNSLQVWPLKMPPAAWAYPQKRMQHFLKTIGMAFVMFVQVCGHTGQGSTHACGGLHPSAVISVANAWLHGSQTVVHSLTELLM